MSEGPVRNLAVDFYRVTGVILIVLGHWLAGSVTYRDGSFGRQNPLMDQPWTHWLTWIFQAVPTFFLVAGYAAAVSWGHWRADDEMSRQTWVRHRLARVLGPSAVYVAVVSAIVLASGRRGSGGLAPGIRGLGGGHAPVVSRRVRDRGLAHADSDCGTASLGTSRAGRAWLRALSPSTSPHWPATSRICIG